VTTGVRLGAILVHTVWAPRENLTDRCYSLN